MPVNIVVLVCLRSIVLAVFMLHMTKSTNQMEWENLFDPHLAKVIRLVHLTLGNECTKPIKSIISLRMMKWNEWFCQCCRKTKIVHRFFFCSSYSFPSYMLCVWWCVFLFDETEWTWQITIHPYLRWTCMHTANNCSIMQPMRKFLSFLFIYSEIINVKCVWLRCVVSMKLWNCISPTDLIHAQAIWIHFNI